jgi:hypothetical protein
MVVVRGGARGGVGTKRMNALFMSSFICLSVCLSVWYSKAIGRPPRLPIVITRAKSWAVKPQYTRAIGR